MNITKPWHNNLQGWTITHLVNNKCKDKKCYNEDYNRELYVSLKIFWRQNSLSWIAYCIESNQKYNIDRLFVTANLGSCVEKVSIFFSLNGQRRSFSSSPESAVGQVLTLADLTPAGSEPNLLSKGRRGTPLITNSQPLRSSYTDLRNVSTHLSPRDQEVYQVYYSVKFLQNVVGFFNTLTIMQYQYIFN